MGPDSDFRMRKGREEEQKRIVEWGYIGQRKKDCFKCGKNAEGDHGKRWGGKRFSGGEEVTTHKNRRNYISPVKKTEKLGIGKKTDFRKRR